MFPWRIHVTGIFTYMNGSFLWSNLGKYTMHYTWMLWISFTFTFWWTCFLKMMVSVSSSLPSNKKIQGCHVCWFQKAVSHSSFHQKQVDLKKTSIYISTCEKPWRGFHLFQGDPLRHTVYTPRFYVSGSTFQNLSHLPKKSFVGWPFAGTTFPSISQAGPGAAEQIYYA